MDAAPEPKPAATDRTAELAQAAYALIAERGIDGFSLRALARRVGATTGLVSHHFLDRAELVAAALDYATQVIVDRVRAAGPDAGPFELLSVVLPTDPATLENWRFAFSVRSAALFDEALRPFPEAIVATWESSLPGLLDGHVDGDPLEATRFLVALVDGIALSAVLDPAGWPARRQAAHLARGFDALTGSDTTKGWS